MMEPHVTVGPAAAVLLLLLSLSLQPFDATAQEGGDLTTRDGVRLHWTGRGGGPDTVVVPGAWMLAGELGPISERHTVIFYDMRSRGRSEPVDDPDRLGFSLDVRDLEDVRRHFGLERMSLVGFSYLGGVVSRYALGRPERVERLVLLGAIPPRSPASYTEAAPGPAEILGPERVRRLQALRERRSVEGDPVALCRAYWQTILPLYAAGPEPADRLADSLDLGCELPNERPGAFERVLGHVMGELRAYDWREDARGLEVPTLVVHGASDHVAPVNGAREWTKVLPEARLVEIEDAGHLLWAERPRRVRTAVRRFLTSPGGRESGERPSDGRNR